MEFSINFHLTVHFFLFDCENIQIMGFLKVIKFSKKGKWIPLIIATIEISTRMKEGQFLK